MLYVLPGIQLNAPHRLLSYEEFLGADAGLPTVQLRTVYEPFGQRKCLRTHYFKDLHISVLDSGWLYTLAADPDYQLAVSADYKTLTAHITAPEPFAQKVQPLLRTALECASAAQGVISLHSACVELEGKAVCFTAPSGVGKSTRAQSWINALGAVLLSGDRPQLRCTGERIFASGTPWDGAECVHTNRAAPLLAICRISRGDCTKIRKLTAAQARRVLMQQCFIPMWDTETAARVMGTISVLSRKAAVYHVSCGPDEKAAREVKELLYHRQEDILQEEADMKIKSGYTLRNVVGENVVMPTGDNIEKFDGAIVLNDMAAFIWKKLENSTSREELLARVLEEYEVDEATAQRDIDALLAKLNSYGVIE